MDSTLRQARAGFRKYLDDLGANAPVPPADVLNRTITPADVRAYPDYFILGPGRAIAEVTNCGHDYHLTDSCPNCDADNDDSDN